MRLGQRSAIAGPLATDSVQLNNEETSVRNPGGHKIARGVGHRERALATGKWGRPRVRSSSALWSFRSGGLTVRESQWVTVLSPTSNQRRLRLGVPPSPAPG
jgi:hypothetical protein